MSCASNSMWKYSTPSTLSACTMVMPLTRCSAWINAPAKYIAWPGDTHNWARRDSRAERAGLDADRQDLPVAGDEPPVIGAPPDPTDRLRLARHRHHPVADLQRLDRHLAVRRQDPRAAAIARRVVLDNQHTAGAVVGQLEGVAAVIVGGVELELEIVVVDAGDGDVQDVASEQGDAGGAIYPPR